MHRYAAISKSWENSSPIGGIEKPEGVADLVEFLLSNKSTYITGPPSMVDGTSRFSFSTSCLTPARHLSVPTSTAPRPWKNDCRCCLRGVFFRALLDVGTKF